MPLCDGCIATIQGNEMMNQSIQNVRQRCSPHHYMILKKTNFNGSNNTNNNKNNNNNNNSNNNNDNNNNANNNNNSKLNKYNENLVNKFDQNQQNMSHKHNSNHKRWKTYSIKNLKNIIITFNYPRNIAINLILILLTLIIRSATTNAAVIPIDWSNYNNNNNNNHNNNNNNINNRNFATAEAKTATATATRNINNFHNKDHIFIDYFLTNSSDDHRRPANGMPSDKIINNFNNNHNNTKHNNNNKEINNNGDIIRVQQIAPQKNQKRHSKRQVSDYIDWDLNSTTLEWVNPCNGHYKQTAGRKPKPNIKKFYNGLRKFVSGYRDKLTSGVQYINITDMENWLYRNNTYKFLPKLRRNRISLLRWYGKMQTYVASFAYLSRVQRIWDKKVLQRVGKTLEELLILWGSSVNMLCELETVYNATHPSDTLDKSLQNKTLPVVTREQMNQRLKFRTKRLHLPEADVVDLKFVKYYYYDFLDKMNLALRNVTRRKGQNGSSGKSILDSQIHPNRKKHMSSSNRQKNDRANKDSIKNGNRNSLGRRHRHRTSRHPNYKQNIKPMQKYKYDNTEQNQ